MLNACLATLAERIRDGSAAGVQVQVDVELTINERRRALTEARKAFEAEGTRFPGLDDRVADALCSRTFLRRAGFGGPASVVSSP